MEKKDLICAAIFLDFFHMVDFQTEEAKEEFFKEIFEENFQCSNPEKIIRDIKSFQSESNITQKIIKKAHENSYKKNNVGKEKEKVIQSIFGKINNYSKEYYYSMKPLALDKNIFPIKKNKQKNDWKEYSQKMLNELKLVTKFSELLNFFDKYLWQINTFHLSDSDDLAMNIKIRLTTALAVSYFHLHNENRFETDEQKKLILIGLDISGIQNFIFDIPSKGAAKSLKGRSTYISLLSEVISKYIIDELELSPANILYNGGGNFYILAPNKVKSNKIDNLKNEIIEKIRISHNENLSVLLSYIELKDRELLDFTSAFNQLKGKISSLKYQKYSTLDSDDRYELLFKPKTKNNQKSCSICGDRLNKLLDNEGSVTCKKCLSLIELTNKLKDSNYIQFKKEDNNFELDSSDFSIWDVLKNFGYSIKLSKTYISNSYILNNTDFLGKDKQLEGYIFKSFQLPMKNNQIKSLEMIAEESINKNIGSKKIGLLKLDVDNLGYIFSKGLGDEQSIASIIHLSFMMNLFFEGYINQLVTDEMYVVYSGGDDSYIIGPWNKIIDFSIKLRESFSAFVANNPDISFSAGISIFNPKYPINKSSIFVEEALDAAKYSEFDKNNIPIKNKINILGNIFNWKELTKIIEIKNFLKEVVIQENRKSVLNRVMKSTLGFERILESSVSGHVRNLKFHRLAYYLRDISKDRSDKLIDIYREIVISNLKSSNKYKYKSIMMIPVAVRLAELELKEEIVNE